MPSVTIKDLNFPLFIVLIIAVVLSYTSAIDGGDFDVYLEAASKLYHGQNPYLPPYAKDGMGYSYSPFFIILLIPFSSAFFLTEFAWCLLSCGLAYRCLVLFRNYLHQNALSKHENKVWMYSLLLLSFQFLSNNIGMVQVTVFLLWAILEGIRLIRNNQYISGGSLIGAIINIKIMPIIILGFLFYRGYFKALFTAILTAILLLLSPSVFWGFEYNLLLLEGWWNIINPTNKEHLMEVGIGMHSLTAFMPVYLMETQGALPYPRNIFHLDPNTAILITHLTSFALICLSLFYFTDLPFKKEKNDLKSIWEISYFVLLIPLVLPHQQKYGFFLAMPMVAYILYFFIKTWKDAGRFHKIIMYSFCIIMLVYSPIHGSDIIGKHAFNVSQHFRLITIVTLLLIPISLYCHPKKLSR
jgi:Glycosyltransferase family 87